MGREEFLPNSTMKEKKSFWKDISRRKKKIQLCDRLNEHSHTNYKLRSSGIKLHLSHWL